MVTLDLLKIDRKAQDPLELVDISGVRSISYGQSFSMLDNCIWCWWNIYSQDGIHSLLTEI